MDKIDLLNNEEIKKTLDNFPKVSLEILVKKAIVARLLLASEETATKAGIAELAKFLLFKTAVKEHLEKSIEITKIDHKLGIVHFNKLDANKLLIRSFTLTLTLFK